MASDVVISNPIAVSLLGVQIAQGLRLTIAMRRLGAGERLPSSRQLAADLRVNFHMVRGRVHDPS